MTTVNAITHTESARMLGVLDDTIENLTIIGRIPLSCDLGELAINLIEDTNNQIEKLREFEEMLHKIDQEDWFADWIFKQVKPIIRSLSRDWRNDPGAATVNKDLKIQTSIQECINYLKQLRDVFNSRLSSTVEQDKAYLQNITELIARTTKAETEKKVLMDEFKAFNKKKEEEIIKADQQISRLKVLIADTKQSYDSKTAQLQKDTQKEQASNLASHEAKESLYNDEYKKVNDALVKDSLSHGELELKLRKRKNKEMNDLLVILDQYDKDCREKEDIMKDIIKKHDEELIPLRRLEELFHKLDWDKSNFDAEEKQLRDDQLVAYNKMKTLIDAATKYQALWRGYCARQAVALLKLKLKKKRKHRKGKKGSKSPTHRQSSIARKTKK